MELFQKATDPKQYDLEALYWEKEGSEESPTRQFFKEFMFARPEKFKGKDVLDIGSGTGWLLEEMRRQGARSVMGVEPSRKNVELSREHYPAVEVVHSSFEDFESSRQYDVIISLMVMVHIADVNAAMQKISRLLRPGGACYLFIPPYEHAKQPRFDYEIATEEINEDEYVVSIKRSFGTITDIIRRRSVYVAAARAAGLELMQEVGMKPSKDFIAREPKYAEFADKPIIDFLRFRRLP